MIHKSSTQPFCRYCGNPIRKATNTIWFGRESASTIHSSITRIPAFPVDQADAQRYSNARIVSVRYSVAFQTERQGHRYVETATTWDGESYQDEFFDTGNCAQAFGRLMARLGHCTVKYNNAVRAHIDKTLLPKGVA